MELAVQAGVMRETPRAFARTQLVVVRPKDNRAGIQALADVARPGRKLVGTPADVPVRTYHGRR